MSSSTEIHGLSTLPPDFLLTTGPKTTTTRIDFAKTSLPEYTGCYAIQLDNVLSATECALLLSAAKCTAQDGRWDRAMVNIGNGEQMLCTDVRSCGRIIWDSQILADRVWARIVEGGGESVKEILRLDGKERSLYLGKGPVKRREVWECARANERMRFLKYEGGEYFRPHCDGCYETPDGQERSYFTMHLYLNGDEEEEPLRGGSTRFHDQYMDEGRSFDVLPATGRVLLFQQRGLRHSGEDVTAGVKYTVRTDIMYRLAGFEDEGQPVQSVEDMPDIKGRKSFGGWLRSRVRT